MWTGTPKSDVDDTTYDLSLGESCDDVDGAYYDFDDFDGESRADVDGESRTDVAVHGRARDHFRSLMNVNIEDLALK